MRTSRVGDRAPSRLSARVSAVIGACAVLVGACTPSAPRQERPFPAFGQDVELLGGSYRRVGDHWFSAAKGALLGAVDGTRYCAVTGTQTMRGSGRYVCFYASGSGTFDRVAVYSEANRLEQFTLRDPLPFRPVQAPRWPGERQI